MRGRYQQQYEPQNVSRSVGRSSYDDEYCDDNDEPDVITICADNNGGQGATLINRCADNNHTTSKPTFTNNLYGNTGHNPCKKLYVNNQIPNYSHSKNIQSQKQIYSGVKYDFLLVKLISNRPNLARHQDQSLTNPWGCVVSGSSLWIANNMSGLITGYTNSGNKLPTEINVVDNTELSRPTDLVENKTIGFFITNGNTIMPSFLLVATENGIISGYNQMLNSRNTIKCIDRSNEGACYKGLELVNNVLYATDFANRRIDVFDSNYNDLFGYDFNDQDLCNPISEEYSPYNIERVNNLLYVSYAKYDPDDPKTPIFGLGLGYVNIFTLGGIFIRRFVSGGKLNAPWGMISTPKSTEYPNGTVFVGNNGDGIINIYGPDGEDFGQLTDMTGTKVQLSGLFSFVPNNSKSFYFTSGPGDNKDGLAGLFTQ